MVDTRKQVKLKAAKRLRSEQTKTEEILWHLLRAKRFLGVKFRRQYIVQGFILDFYCPSARLGIEIDGGVHMKTKEYDKERDKIIAQHDIKILRFSNDQVLYETDKVLNAIKDNFPKTALSMIMERGDRPAKGGMVGEVYK